jgi:hypothetical protein
MHTDSPTESRRPAPEGRERRQHPRVAAEWPITLVLAEGRFEARLRDVSAAGVCFFLDRKIEEMTILELAFELPAGPRLRCRGAVVRCEPLSPRIDHYEIAVFLHEVTDAERAAIDAYIASGARPV